MEHDKSLKKPEQGCSGYQLETTALISIDNYNAFRIRCIMLILEILNSNRFLKYSILGYLFLLLILTQ